MKTNKIKISCPSQEPNMNQLPWLTYLWKKAGLKHFVYICALTQNIRNYDGNQGRLQAFNFS